MLSFLHLARMAGFTVTTYEDRAEGTTKPKSRPADWR